MKTLLIFLLSSPFLIQAQPLQQNPQYYNQGITYSYHEGGFNQLSEFASLVPLRKDTVKNFTASVSSKAENFALVFNGFINLPVSGQYIFYTSSDDGSALYIDNMLMVWNDGLHYMQERSGTIYLTAGFHSIQVPYFQKLGGIGFSVSYSGPGFAKQQVPDSVLFREDTTLFFMPCRYLVSDTIKDSAGNALTTTRPVMVEGYDVYKTVHGATYLLLIDRLDLQKNKLPKNYFVWLSK